MSAPTNISAMRARRTARTARDDAVVQWSLSTGGQARDPRGLYDEAIAIADELAKTQ